MTELLVAIVLSVCAPSTDGGTTECMEQITNCAVEMKTLITESSIKKCLEEYNEGIEQ